MPVVIPSTPEDSVSWQGCCLYKRLRSASSVVSVPEMRRIAVMTEGSMTVTQVVLLAMGLVVAYWGVRILLGGARRG